MNKLLIGFLLTTSFSIFATSTFDIDSIRNSLKDHIPQLRGCYQQELDRAKNPEELQGRLIFNFKIGVNGSVLNSEITSVDTLSERAIDCMKNVLQGIQFQVPNDGKVVEVRQPMNLYPKRN